MTVIVTGAGGLTGGDIARRLVAQGRQVIAVSRRDPSVPGAESVIGDIGDPRVLAPHIASAETIIHVAGIVMAPRLAQVAGLSAVRRLVIVSSAGVYSAHRSSAASYLAGEHALSEAHPGPLFLRPTMIYGASRDRNIHHVISFARRFGVLPQIGDGHARLQPIHFEDLAAAAVAFAGTDHSGIVDAGGAAPISLRALLLDVFAALGQPARIVRLPIGSTKVAAQIIELAGVRRITERIERLEEDRTVDITALVALAGIRPRAFEVGVRDQVAMMRADGALR